MKISTIAIKRPVTTVMLFIGLGLLGAISYTLLPVQLIPNYIYPKMFVVAGYPGATPEKVEEDLVERLEAEIATLDDIEEITSESSLGYGVITVSYKLGTDLNYAYLKLEQKVNGLVSLMPVTSTMQVFRFDTSSFSNYVMQLSVSGPGGLEYLRQVTEDRIRPRLEAVSGVVDVSPSGGNPSAIQVNLDDDRIRSYGITPTTVLAALNAFHQRREYMGEVLEGNRRFFVMLEGRLTDLDQVKNVVVSAQGGALVHLKDVAEVYEAPDRETQTSRVDGNPTVQVLIQKDEQSNLIRVARLLRAEVKTLNQELESAGISISASFDAAELIEDDIARMKRLVLSGAILALLVLLIFLKRPRSVSIVALAIPTALLVSLFPMYFFGLSIDVITLIGLTISVGLLVDNSIVVQESITRYLDRGMPRMEAAIRGSSEVYKAIIVGTLTTVSVFLPLLWVKTEFTELYNDFALAVIFPVTVSLLVAVTLVPMLVSRTGGHRQAPYFNPDADWTLETRKRPRRTLQLYTVLLKQVSRHQVATTVIVFFLLIFTVVITLPLILYLYDEPRPPVSRIEMKLEMPEGADLDATLAVTEHLEALTMDLPDRDMTRSNVREGEAYVTVELLDPEERKSERTLAQIRKQLQDRTAEITGARVLFDQSQFSGGGGDDEGGAAAFLGLGNPREEVVLTGEKMDRLAGLAREVRYRLEQLDGVNSDGVTMDMEDGTPELRLEARYDDLSNWGLSMQQVMALLWMARREGEQTQFDFRDLQENEKKIMLRLEGEDAWSLSDLQDLTIPTPQGDFVRITELVDISRDSGLTSIKRHQGTHRVRIFFSFEPGAVTSQRQLEKLRAEVESYLYAIPLPRGYTLTMEKKEEEENVWKFMIYTALILIYLILAAAFESFAQPLLILLTIPLALVGVLVLLALTGVGFGPLVFLALLVLVGIVVNNGILLIDYARYLVKEHGFRPERAVIASGRARLRPVIMTATTTIVAMLPLAMMKGGENEIWPPFAIAVIGGLSFSSAITLIFVPMMYLSFNAIRLWMKHSIGIPWTLLGTALTGAFLWLLYYQLRWVESEVWRIIFVLPIWFACLGIVWFILWIARGRSRREEFSPDEPLDISISNLRKIYGEDGPFLRGLKQVGRWKMNAGERGMDVAPVRLTVGDLIWKIPLLALLVYVHFYFENRFWLFVFAWVTWYVIRDLLVTLMLLWRRRRTGAADTHPVPRRVFSESGWLNLIFGLSMGLLTLIYVHVRCDLHYGFTLTFAVILGLTMMAFRTGARLRRAELVIDDKARGFFRGIKNGLLRMVAAIPRVGREKDLVPALQGVSLEIGSGMFGLLGPNGAGKTTLMRVICNIYEQSRGTVGISGRDPRRHRDAVQALVGYLPQNFGTYENFNAWELLNYYALLNEIWDKEERRQLVTSVLKQVNLFERKDEKLKGYSGGMKQRIGIATALLHLPRIIVVDEATAGLDPKERIRFRNLLAELAKERIVIFSTHIVEDISGTCNRVAVVNKGRVVFDGTVEEMTARAEGRVFEAVVEETRLNELNKRLKVVGHIGEGLGHIRLRYLADQPDPELESETVTPNLEDAYLFLLGGTAQPA